MIPFGRRVLRRATRAAARLYAGALSSRDQHEIQERIKHEPGFEEDFLAAHHVLGAVDRWAPELEADEKFQAAIESPARGLAALANRRYVKWGAAATAAAMIVVAIVAWQSRLPPGDSVVHRYATAVGEQTEAVLGDGSRIWLNTDSEIVVTITRGQRRATLQKGEAYFAVARDLTRPFTVELQGQAITALGTEFNIRHVAGGFHLSLVEGSLAVGRQGQDPFPDGPLVSPVGTEALEFGAEDQVRIAGGTSLWFDTTRQRTRVQNEPNIRSAQRWRRGIVSFRDAPLGELVAELNRYSPKPIVLLDPELGERLIVSTTLRVIPVDEGLEHLAGAYPIRVSPLKDRIVIAARASDQE